MKKFFSFLAAVLFAGSMMAVDFTLESADAVTVDGVTVTFDKGEGTNAPAWYSNGLRLYANNTVTVSSESAITAITFNWQKQGAKAFNTATASVGEYTHPEAAGEGKWTGSANSVTFTLGTTGQLLLNTFTVTLAEGGETPVEPTMDYYVAGSMTNWGPMAAYKLAANPANEGEYMGEFTFAANDEFKVGYSDGTTIESTNYFPNGMDNNYVITEAGDYTVYFRPDGQGGEDWHYGCIKAIKKEAPVLADPTNCAEAAEAALSVATNNELYNNGAVYTIEGYVTSIAYAWKSGSMSFWMADAADGGNVLEAYKCAIADEADAVRVGDKVQVTGSLTKYNTTPEFAQGCTVRIIERAEVVDPVNLGAKTIAEFLELKNTKDTCILTGVVSNIVNTTYGNFDLTDESGTVYVYGLLTPEGESKKFADLNVAENDTLTVLAIYNEYNGNPQAKNAIFVEVKKAAVEPGETIELVFTAGGVDNYYYDTYGSTDIQLYNIPVVGGQLQGDGDFLQLEIYPADPNDISGEYSIEDEGLDGYYTYLMHIEGTDTTEIEFVDGSITVSVQNADKEASSADLTVQGQLTTAEGDVYVINTTLNVYYNFALTEEEKYQNDEEEAEFNYNFDSYQLGALNEVVVGVMAQTDEAGIALAIILPEGQTELTAGTYEISVTPMYGTVMAGQNTEMGMSPSYAMTADEKLWFLVSGTVTVNEDGSIVVDALNSKGKAVKSTLNHLRGEGIDEVNAAKKAVKYIENGQLIIEKAGVRYNAAGQIIR